MDRIYCATASPLHLVAGGRTLSVAKCGLPDAVVWNPWIAKSAAMADFGACCTHSLIPPPAHRFATHAHLTYLPPLRPSSPPVAGDEEYKGMVCIEAAAVEQPLVVGVGAEWTGSQLLSVRSAL